MEKILYFCPEGMPDTKVNDVENCRISTAFKNDNGEKIFLEVSSGYHHTFSGKKLLKSEDGFLIVHPGECYYITDDPTIDDCNDSRFLPSREAMPDYKYTKENILKFVNEYCNCSFTKIEILHEFSGYYPLPSRRKYNFSNDFINIPARNKAREKIFNEVAKEYFTSIYKKNIEKKKLSLAKYKRELEDRRTWSVKSMDDNTITLHSYAYDELINDEERDKTFEVIY